MTIALIISSAIGTAVLVCVAVLRWCAARNVENLLDEIEAALPAPALPAGHRPPPGLGPISPSERALAAEIEAGLRDLQLYLLDAA